MIPPRGSKHPLVVIRDYLGQAIGIGAPAYNTGDHRGCYEVYACTARMLLHTIEDGADDAKKVLRSALRRASTVADVDEQAWIMRHAFDSILGKENN